MTDRQSYSIIEAEAGFRLPKDHHEYVTAEITQRCRDNLKAVAGVHQALEAISLAKCVASSSDVEKLRVTLKITSLYDYFAPHVFSASQVARGKPAPDLFLFAAEKMNTPADRCVVIEDSVVGIQAAVAAGMMVIGFIGGSHCPPCHAEKLMEAGAIRIFSHMTALPRVLGGL
ncbi:haloacid dehalogenase superfamily, subfamily IA, variant 3 with third motif having DD or ED [Rhizobium tibeticum]|uniref:6-phosphogluconate phosphatase n=1 Tax=Rhizobium tibeticum TaxID=501024 RepID=A0A1H8VUX3_9HYPH|nr:6-phosphogluconate phosphatase [Rhizobium tibeticum]SEP18718.1 haloacid dehalogenase superfamily, subfamily IA, variant 3 with third motif having DD or ED [Rhizobium tibeticum]